MATRILGPTGSKRRRRFLLAPMLLVAVAAFFVIAGAQANPPEQAGFFELDKNVINNEQTPSVADSSTPPVQRALGVLGGNISATATSFIVCQTSNTNPPTSNPALVIQVDAERMTVGAIASASGGGCPQGTFKRTYSSVTRGADVPAGFTTDPASHGASGVSGYVTRLTFNTVAGDDWDQVRAAVLANGSPSDTNPNPCSDTAGSVDSWTGNPAAQACDFIHDDPNQTVFTTGGSKDDLDINVGTTHNWMYTNSSVPDADDITDGYAIKYQGPNAADHQFLYFGADRVAVNGSKDMGFWFFKSPVSLNADGTFSGQHTVGDILLLSTFSGGGATTTIRIFKWVGTGGDTNTVLQSGGNFGDCVPGGSSDGCNTVNNGSIHSPWAYQSKISGTPADTIYAGGAMEGGVDLTALGLTGCFSSFMAETRSAPEVGAQLKDFLLGRFESCGSSLTTTPKDGNGNPIPAGGLSIGTGIVSGKDSADLQVTGTDTWSGTFKFFLCGPIPTADTCNGTAGHVGLQIGDAVNLNVTPANPFSGPIVSAAARLTSAANNTTGAPGHYCWRGVFTSTTDFVDSQTDATQGECFFVNPVTPTLVTTAVEAASGLSPTIYGGKADLNGSGTADSADDSTDFYGDTDIIDGQLDCNAWGTTPSDVNKGTGGSGVIDGSDDCTLVGYDGTSDGVTIGVVNGSFATADGVAIADGTPLPKVFPDPSTPNDPSVVNAKFAWSTIFGKVDSNGNGGIDGDDCANNVVGNAGILGDTACGSPVNGFNGKVDLNADGTITSADACTNECFLGHDVAHGLVVAGTVPFGQPVYDAATLTGTATQPGTNGPGDSGGNFKSIYQASDPPIPNGANAAGTIDFTLLGPGDCSTVAAKKTGTIGSNPETGVVVNGNGDYKTSGFTTALPGVFHWQAVYSGNNPNTLGTNHNVGPPGCTDAGEDVTVQQIPTDVKTKQSWFPNDHATITSTVAGTTLLAGGHVDFTLYDTATCSGTALYTERQDLAGGSQSEEVLTHNYPGSAALTPGGATVTPYREPTGYADAANTTTGARSWKVVYTPLAGDTAHTGSSSECLAGHTEKHTYTYTNDPGH